MGGRGRVVGRVGARVLLLLGVEVGYLVVLEVEVWEGGLVAGGLAEGPEVGLVEDQVGGQEVGQEAKVEAWDPSFLQASLGASRTEVLLVGGLEAVPREDQEVSWEEQGAGPAVEAQSLVDLACVVALAAPQAHQEGEDAGWPLGGAGCLPVVPGPQCQSCQIHQCTPPLLPPPPLREQIDLPFVTSWPAEV